MMRKETALRLALTFFLLVAVETSAASSGDENSAEVGAIFIRIDLEKLGYTYEQVLNCSAIARQKIERNNETPNVTSIKNGIMDCLSMEYGPEGIQEQQTEKASEEMRKKEASKQKKTEQFEKEKERYVNDTNLSNKKITAFADAAIKREWNDFQTEARKIRMQAAMLNVSSSIAEKRIKERENNYYLETTKIKVQTQKLIERNNRESEKNIERLAKAIFEETEDQPEEAKAREKTFPASIGTGESPGKYETIDNINNEGKKEPVQNNVSYEEQIDINDNREEENPESGNARQEKIKEINDDQDEDLIQNDDIDEELININNILEEEDFPQD